LHGDRLERDAFVQVVRARLTVEQQRRRERRDADEGNEGNGRPG
jgi:hypothetical protein